MGPTRTKEDTYVAVLERAPQKNEEVMIVFTKVVQCQQMVYLSVHGPRVGKGPTVRMAAFNDGNVCILRLVAIYCHNRQRYKTDTTRVGPATDYHMLVIQVLLVRECKNNA
jgi:hypothetical protein